MSLFKRLFGGGGESTKDADPVDYQGYRIFPEPVQEQGSHRIAARIEKEVDGELKTHHMIRADTYGTQDTAIEASVQKARQMIDQMGEALFG